MHIVVVTDEFSPLTGRTPFAEQVFELSVGLKQSGCDLKVVLPTEDPAAVQTYSLARRLKSIGVEMDGARYDWHRYDGRTPEGLDIHLLHLQGDRPKEGFSKIFAAASARLIESGIQRDFCLGAGKAGLHLAAELNGAADCIALLSGSEPNLQGIGFCKAAIRIGAMDETAHEGTPVFALQPWATKPAVGTFEKAAAKASLQSTFALPITADVPLVFAKDTGDSSLAEILAAALRRDLQIALITGKDAAYEDLREKYPDRLALIPAGALQATALAAADLSVGHESTRTVLESLAVGTVPIAPLALADLLVDLEPSLESGSGFICNDGGATALDEALGRGLAAWTDREAFTELQDRLPALVTTVNDQAKRVLEILAL